MACLTHLEYLIQVERNPLAFCGRRILSAILMCQTNPGSKQRPAVTVLSLGTGEYQNLFFIFLLNDDIGV